MTNSEQRKTEAPPASGQYQRVSTAELSLGVNTNAESQEIRTVTTKSTQGEIVLRYTPREPSDSQNTK